MPDSETLNIILTPNHQNQVQGYSLMSTETFKRQIVSKLCCHVVLVSEYLDLLWNGIVLSSRRTSLDLV